MAPALIIVIVVVTTTLSGIAFYTTEMRQAGIYAWIFSGITAASLSLFCTMGFLYIRRITLARALKPPPEDGHGRSKEHWAHERLRNHLIMVAISRKMAHETGNFLNNIDLVLHVLRNEDLSPKGKKILRLLADESLQIKTYIPNYRRLLVFPEISLKKENLEHIIKNAAVKWRQEQGWHGPEIKTDFQWPQGKARGCMNAALMQDALFFLLTFTSRLLKNDKTIEIRAKFNTDNIVVAITHNDIETLHSGNMDMFAPFSEAGVLSNMFAARALIEAHGGTLSFTEDFQGKPAFQFSLPFQIKKAPPVTGRRLFWTENF